MRLTGTVECAAWTERQLFAMGSPATVIAGDAPAGSVEWAVAELDRLEHSWSRFLADSELAALNRSAGTWHEMSPTLAAAVDRALRLHELTDGRFDPTVHDCLVALGYDRPFAHVARHQPAPLPRSTPAPGVAGILRDGAGILLPAGTSIDLGGVGKGLAADLIATGLLARGARSACVSLGGDIRVAGGVPDQGGWKIPVADPFVHDGVIGHVQVADAAIVTSTTTMRTWTRDGARVHHLVDPATGLSADTGVSTVVVVGPEAWLAEGFAKSALIAGAFAGRRLLDHAGLAGWLFTNDGNQMATEWAPPMNASLS